MKITFATAFILFLIFLAMLCLYTQVISWQYNVYKEHQRMSHEHYIDQKISELISRRSFYRGKYVQFNSIYTEPDNPGN